VISKITSDHILIKLENGLIGVLDKDDISDEKTINNILEDTDFEVDKTLECAVKSIDYEKFELKLSSIESKLKSLKNDENIKTIKKVTTKKKQKLKFNRTIGKVF
jgi:ribosomal protein S1